MICASAVPDHRERDHRAGLLPAGHRARQLPEPERDQDEQAAEHRARRRARARWCDGSAAGPRGCRSRTRPRRPRPRASRRRPTSRPAGAPRRARRRRRARPGSRPAAARARAHSACQRIASSTTKIGIEALAIAATPESMYRSPQAISVNGIAPLKTPSAKPSPAERAHLDDRPAEAALRREHDEQQRRREREPQHHHRRRREGAVGDLDEQVGRAPERGEKPDVDHVRAAHPPEATAGLAPGERTLGQATLTAP